MRIVYYHFQAFHRRYSRQLLLLLSIFMLYIVNRQGEGHDLQAEIGLTSASHILENNADTSKPIFWSENRIQTQVLAPDAESSTTAYTLIFALQPFPIYRLSPRCNCPYGLLLSKMYSLHIQHTGRLAHYMTQSLPTCASLPPC